MLLAFCFLPLAARAQNEWVLQPFIERTGTAALQELGKNVAGFMGSFGNNPYNVAVSQVGQTGLYKVRTPNNTNAPTVYWGENVIHGDFNGDRFTDYVIWKSFNYSDTVLVYWGTATGIDTLSPLKIFSEERLTYFGMSKCAGDINGDRIDDLVVSAPNFGLSQGKIYIYLGGKNFSPTPSYVIIGENRTQLGTRCAAGDLNSDGFDDLAVRGSNSNDVSNIFGYINIYFGGTPFDTTKDLVSLSSPKESGTNGMSIFDANGDSRPDLLWSRHDAVLRDDKIYLHWGGNDFFQRFQRGPDFIIPNPDSQQVFGVVYFGQDIANAGDMNGDGYNDIVVGTRSSRSGTSYVFVFSGGKALDATFDAAKGQALDSDFGRSVAGLGDVNSDGLSDIIVGAPDWKFGTREGYWGIFLGDRRITTSVKVKSTPPALFSLYQNYPNPFKAGTRIEFSLPEAGLVKILIYDITGAQVRNLLGAYHDVGTYAANWDGNDDRKQPCASGVYLLKLSVNGAKGGEIHTATQKMILAR